MDFQHISNPQWGTAISSPAVNELKELIESDPKLLKQSIKLFTQIHPGVDSIFNNILSLLGALDNVIQGAPAWSLTAYSKGCAGCSITNLLSLYLFTSTGYEILSNAKVNDVLHNVLRGWAKLLSLSDSTDVLTDKPNGWFSAEALAAMPDFEKTFVCNSSQPHLVFKSWDAFFTQQLCPGARPMTEPYNHSVIVSPCDSTTFCIHLSHYFRNKSTK